VTAPLRLTSAFSPTKRDLIRQMEADGWTGRVTAGGHAFMRAPDGVATCSITPKDRSGNSLNNDLAPYRTWLKARDEAAAAAEVIQTAIAVPEQPARPLSVEPVDTPDTAPDTSVTCEDCGRVFAALQALSVHRVRVHVRVACRICLEPFSPGNLDRHTAVHLRELEDPIAVLAELHRLRREAAEWQTLAEDAESRAVALREATQRALEALLDV
jgi:predicted RNA binding protein YcfA (HicA-like mRNA interferase family)